MNIDKDRLCGAMTFKVPNERLIWGREQILGNKLVHQLIDNQALGSSDLKHFLGMHSPFINWLKSLSLDSHYSSNEDLILESLTHSSFRHENKEWPMGDNERLEFLGDAVLDSEISRRLFTRFPNFNEGELSRLRSALVNEEVLAKWACVLRINEFIMLGKGEASKESVGQAILADAFEAMVGALSIISPNSLSEVIDDWVVLFDQSDLTEKPFFCPSRLDDFDPKTRLQEVCLENFKVVAHYKTVLQEERGQEMIFSSRALCGETFLGEGVGTSKKRAQSAAAKAAIKSVALSEMISKHKQLNNEEK